MASRVSIWGEISHAIQTPTAATIPIPLIPT